MSNSDYPKAMFAGAAAAFAVLAVTTLLPSANLWLNNQASIATTSAGMRVGGVHQIGVTNRRNINSAENPRQFSRESRLQAGRQGVAEPSKFDLAIISGMAMLGGYIAGRLLFAAKPSFKLMQEEVAMAAYQSEFAPGGRPTMHLGAAASKAGDDADAKKKVDALLKEAQEKMEAALEATATKFNSVRTGRANPALLDRVRVDYYGTLTPLKQMAGLSVPDASTIVISPFDRTAIGAIEKAIGAADLGVTPSNDGQVIRIKVPPLTEDRRKEMVKSVAKMGEEGKVAIRNVRRDILKSADKLSLSEDAEAGFKDDIQKVTDKFTKKIDDISKAKEKDLTTI